MMYSCVSEEQGLESDWSGLSLSSATFCTERVASASHSLSLLSCQRPQDWHEV